MPYIFTYLPTIIHILISMFQTLTAVLCESSRPDVSENVVLFGRTSFLTGVIAAQSTFFFINKYHIFSKNKHFQQRTNVIFSATNLRFSTKNKYHIFSTKYHIFSNKYHIFSNKYHIFNNKYYIFINKYYILREEGGHFSKA